MERKKREEEREREARCVKGTRRGNYSLLMSNVGGGAIDSTSNKSNSTDISGS